MKDRAMQALYASALDPIAETTGDNFSFGFRKTRSTYDANKRSHMILCKGGAPKWIFEADIEGCFDNISHDWLIENIPMDKIILKRWLKAGYLDRNVFRDTLKGTPQGGIISPILANMTLDGLEKTIAAKVGRAGSWRGNHNKVHLNRFADDFYITAVDRELLERDVVPTVKEFLAKRGLKLSEEKSRITHIDDGFNFLGQNIRKRKGKLLITPSKESVKRIKSKMRGVVHKAWWCPAESMIKILNSQVRGWYYYHRHIVSKRIYQSLEHYAYILLWKWIRKKHPQKSHRWIVQKYFGSVGRRRWIFMDGKEKLFMPSTIKIRRHEVINGNANPYDTEWQSYYEGRISRSLASKRPEKLKKIRAKQSGKCWNCNRPIGDPRAGLIQLREGNIALEEKIPSQTRLVHKECHAGSRKGL